MNNAGKYRHRIHIFKVTKGKDSQGFPVEVEEEVIAPYAEIKTTRGMTLIINSSDFEKAYTRFVFRYPKVDIQRDWIVKYNHKTYTIEYINNVDESNAEIELQCKEVEK